MVDTDSDLVRRSLAGQLEAYDELVRRHQDAVFNLLMNITRNWHETDDLTQETFIRAYRRLSRYDARYPFKNWVMAIGVNLSKNRFRSLFRRRRIEEESRATPDRSPPHPAVEDPRLQPLLESMRQLPDTARIPLVLRHMEGCSYDEIARILGIGVSAAKMRVRRAREDLIRRLDGASLGETK